MTASKRKASEAARELSKLGAKKGGAARASSLSPGERREIAKNAAATRWKIAKGDKYVPPKQEGEEGEAPYSLYSGNLDLNGITIECHVLNDYRRVLTQRQVVSSLGMSRGSSGGTGGDRLAKFLAGKALSPFVSSKLRAVTTRPMNFLTLSRNQAYGYEATILSDICEAVLDARAAKALQKQQLGIAGQCEILMRAFAKTGIIALVDEATGFQKVRAKHALQLKLQAFIADEMQEWAKLFPDEFWLELARLEGIEYSPRSRPLRWGKYVMNFVYDAIDKDVGKELRKKNPNPQFLRNHHQWLKQFGRDKVTIQIEKVVTIMKLCDDMKEFRRKFARVFNKPDLVQLSFDEIGWDYRKAPKKA